MTRITLCIVSSMMMLVGCDNSSNGYKSLLLLYGVSAIENSRIIQDNEVGHYERYSGDGPVICFMGDSRIEMYRLGKYFPRKNMINYGRSGSTTKGIIKRVPIVIGWNPDIIVISTGFNNISRLYLYPDIVGDIISSCKAITSANPAVTIYVTNIVPATGAYDSKAHVNATIQSYNDHLEKACAENGLIFLHINGLEDAEGNLNSNYSDDGVHYNESGYDSLTLFLRDTIPELAR